MADVYDFDFDLGKLISIIREHSFIYNPKDSRHCNRILVSSTWGKIAREMNTTEKMCKSKWTTLRSNYVREFRRQNDMTSPPKDKWAYFDMLSFLQPFIKHGKMSQFSSDVEPEDDTNTSEHSFKQEELFIDERNWTEIQPSEIRHPEMSESQRKKPSVENETYIPRTNHKDDDKYFLLSLLPQMKLLNHRDNLMFRLEVQQLMINKLYP